MNLIRKFWVNKNYNNYFWHTGGIIFGILVIISTFLCVKFTFNIDFKEDYKNLSIVMEENRSDIEKLITHYNYGSLGLENKCNIKFSQEEVVLTSYKQYWVGSPEIKYAVIKSNGVFFIDERYTAKEEYIARGWMLYFGFIGISFFITFFIILLIFSLLSYIDRKYINKSNNITKEISDKN